MYPLLFLSLFTHYFTLHDFHVSTTYGQFKGPHLQVTTKVFTDDLEEALEQNTDINLALGTKNEAKAARKLMEEYLNTHFKLKGKSKQWQAFKFIGFEVELDITYIYLEYTFDPWPKQVTVKNTLLHDLFPDQTNLVNLEQAENLQSVYCNKENPVQTLNF